MLWLIEALDHGLHLSLQHLGVYPRTATGLVGVLFAPLIHSSWDHLLSNSFALLVLGTILRYGYPRAAGPALTLIYLLSGVGVLALLFWMIRPLRTIWPYLLQLPWPIQLGLSALLMGFLLILASLIVERMEDRGHENHLRDD